MHGFMGSFRDLDQLEPELAQGVARNGRRFAASIGKVHVPARKAAKKIVKLGELAGHTSKVFSAAFAPSGQILATSSADQTVRLWDTATRQEKAVLKGHTEVVWSVAFSPDGTTLASAGADRVVIGTDYPYDMGCEQPVDFVNGSKSLTRAQKDAIISGNAARLLKLKPRKRR